jgi:hypothetical protein
VGLDARQEDMIRKLKKKKKKAREKVGDGAL